MCLLTLTGRWSQESDLHSPTWPCMSTRVPTTPCSSSQHTPCLSSAWPFTSRGRSASCCCLSRGALPALFGSHDSAPISIEPLHCMHFSETLLGGHLRSAGLTARVHGAGGSLARLVFRRAKVPAVCIWGGTSTHCNSFFCLDPHSYCLFVHLWLDILTKR